MAYIQPFSGIMYDPARAGALSDLLCPPYDIISGPEQERLHQINPHNIVHLELGLEQPGDVPGADRYSRAGAIWEDWLDRGVLAQDRQLAFYVYEQSWADRKRMAFFAAVRLAPWTSGEVLPHELTLSGPKKDRLQLMRHTGANLSPVMGLYEDADGTVKTILEEAMAAQPVLQASLGDETHKVWRLTAWDAIAAIQESLAGRPIFIADGHHRYETALTYRDERRQAQGAYSGEEPWNYVLMALCSLSDPGLVVLPTHRLVRAPDLDRRAFLERLGRSFRIEEAALGDAAADARSQAGALLRQLTGKHRLAMVLGGDPAPRILELATAPELALTHLPQSKPWRELAVAHLHYLILADVLGIPESEWKGGQHLVYTRDSSEVLSRVSSGEFDVGFLLEAPPVDQITRVALAGDVMPQKSTYFYPKLPTGLVVHRLDEHPASIGAPSP